MNTASNLNKKIIYGLAIVALFGAMYPYNLWLGEVKQRARPGRGRYRAD